MYIEINISFDTNDYDKFFKNRYKLFKENLTNICKSHYKIWLEQRGEIYSDNIAAWHKDY